MHRFNSCSRGLRYLRRPGQRGRAGGVAALAVAGLLGLVISLTSEAQAIADSHQTASRIDALLAQEHFGAEGTHVSPRPAKIVDDETYLRRLSLDLIGALPAPEEVIRFALDTDPNKRSTAVQRLLADKQYGQNWSRYWRDVVFYRRKEERALLAAPAFNVWMADALNHNEHWDQIAKQIITAVGDVRENGATALIMSQSADPNDTAAEVSRIFLGIQIQCAQCHNHPSDHWKREQFHQFAAFFPRIGLRPDRGGEKKSFDVVSLNRPNQKRTPGSPDEATLEQYMPDLNHPKEKGTLMQPVFFPTGQQLPAGMSDLERREKLALWITASGDRWFAKAFVNRMWSELVGHGFCEPVDDMGPDRQPVTPQAFEALTTEFMASHYDVKWLLRTITATAAYQRESRSRHEVDQPALASSCPQRLRADQLFNVICDALEIDETAVKEGGGPNGKKMGDGPGRFFAGPRGTVNRVFGYDPSTRRDEIGGSIPQSLWMMNAHELNRAVSTRSPESMLSRLLAAQPDDRQVLLELYLRCLAREPKPSELATCQEYLASVHDRNLGFEDILWALINSTEFLNRK
jgi:predicted Rdx family selenoprotein